MSEMRNAGCTIALLSPRERAGVRGNSALKLQELSVMQRRSMSRERICSSDGCLPLSSRERAGLRGNSALKLQTALIMPARYSCERVFRSDGSFPLTLTLSLRERETDGDALSIPSSVFGNTEGVSTCSPGLPPRLPWVARDQRPSTPTGLCRWHRPETIRTHTSPSPPPSPLGRGSQRRPVHEESGIPRQRFLGACMGKNPQRHGIFVSLRYRTCGKISG